MVHLSTIRANLLISTQAFLMPFRCWMGHFISLCTYLPIQIYTLIYKISQTSLSILRNTPHLKPNLKPNAYTFKNKKIEKENSPFLSKKNHSSSFIQFQNQPNFSSLSNQKNKDLLPEKIDSIVESLFINHGFKGSLKKIIEEGIIFDLKSKEQMNPLLRGLNGHFQLEWNLKTPPSTHSSKLIYKGALVNGIFHGEGSFLFQALDGSHQILAKGYFEKGQLLTGLFALDHCYIEGTFINGEKRGTGIIHYFSKEKDDNYKGRLQYRGEYFKGEPHGKGEIWILSPEGIQLMGEGEFKKGQVINGFFQREDYLFEGKFDEKLDLFHGKISNLVKRFIYEGIWQNNAFHGQGKLRITKSINREVLDSTEKDGFLKITNKIEDFVCTLSGEFYRGQLLKGEEKIEWKDGSLSTSSIENYKTVNTIVETPTGFKYEGNFIPYTLTGTGKMFNRGGIEIYQGNIRIGYPHGEGCIMMEDGSIKKGIFKWGKFLKDK